MIRLLLAVIVLGRVGSLAEAGSSIPTVSFKSSSGGGQVTFIRKGATKDGAQIVKVTLAEAVTPRDPSTGMATGKRQWRAVRIVMSGADAPACSLLYPVLALGRGGAAALSALQGQGLDCSVTDAGSVDCQTQVSAETCTGLASQLAENIDAVLAVDDAPERAAFQSGSAALGIAVCATTTTTTATTTTTIAGGSTTTVVTATTTTTTIPCGFVPGSGGSAAGMCGGSCPPGQTCLLNSPNGNNCQCRNPGVVCTNNTSCGIGLCPVQFEHCQSTPSGCDCCTMDGNPCNAATVCCSGQACDLTFHCPSSTTTTTTSPSTTSTSGAATTSTSTTTTTVATATTTTTTIPCGFVAGSGGSGAGMCGGSCPAGQTCLMNSPSGNKCSCQNPGIVCTNNTSCGIGACPVQFEHCQSRPSGCDCCTLDGDPCNATTVCCSGQACDLTFHCPSSTTTTTTSPATTTTSGAATTSTSSTTSTTAACVPQGGHCTTIADCCPGTGVFCNTSGGAGTGFCDVLP